MSSKKSPSSSDENLDESELSRKLKSCVRGVERRLTPSSVVDLGDLQVPVLFADHHVGDSWDTSHVSHMDVVDIPDAKPVETPVHPEIVPPVETVQILPAIEIAPHPTDLVAHFDSGVFTVGETGKVGVDFLYDGGGYSGQLAIFSLKGMDAFDANSAAFIHEAATRALSNSNLGYILIDDLSQAARFASADNGGQYLGEQSFTMQSGDRFGMILVPNGTVQTVFDTPDADGEIRPLFSMATANPNDAYHVGQIADVFGDGKTFVFEDLRVDKGSDGDFNDLIFRLKGATGQAATFDQLIADGLLDPEKDFRHTEIGQQIAANAESYIADGKTFPGDPLHPALPAPAIPHTNVDQGGNGFSGVIGTSVEPNQGGALPDLPTLIKHSLTQDVIDQVGGNDPFDIYRVSGQQLTGTEISVLSGSTTISVLTPTGEILSQQVFDRGTHTLNLPTDIAGEVLLKFSSTNGADSTYILQGFESQAKEPFNIDLEFASGITASQQAIIREAANFVQSLIGQGLPSAIVDGKIIDDVNFKISATNLDGTGGTLAQTKIDFMRYGTLLPAQSITQFDLSDLAKLEQSGQLADVVKHELLHGLGFGNLWEAKGLIAYANTPLMQYQGKQAVQKFQELGGLTDGISLETAGRGSAGLHWHEALFQDEIMTADLSGGVGKAAISAVTLASLADLGYVVNLAKATPDYGLFGSQGFNPNNLTSEQIEAFRELAETSFGNPTDEFIYAVMPEVDPDKISPEIWAHAERFWKNGEYYDWSRYQIRWGDTLSQIALDTMGSANPDYYRWIANHNGIPNPNYIVTGDWIDIPVWHPNYEWEQEQERLRREEELRRQQEEEARRQKEAEDKLKNDLGEQERLRLELERLRLEAEARQRELDEQARRLAEELERKRQRDEFLKEQARLAELARLAEIARQQGKGGQEWYFAKTMPEFGPVDPFETRLTGETVGNLVPDDYYRFTLSRPGRIDARLMKLLADADLVLYDSRSRPISYSMREGLTDEQIVADLIPGTYLLRVNSPKGVTTDYDLVVKFQHKLSMTQQGPPPGWRVGGGTGNGGGVARPTFADPRLENIFVTAVNQFSAQKWAAAQPQLNQLAAEKEKAQQDLNALLAQMIVEQKNNVYAALDNTRGSLRDQVSGQANNLKGNINNFADNAINGVNGLIPDWVKNIPWLGDRVKSAQDTLRDAVNNARNGLNGYIDWIRDRVNDAIWQFIEMIKNAYITGGEINAKIDEAANWLKGKLDEYANSLNNKIGDFKGWILGGLGWTSNIGVGDWNVYDDAIVPFVNGIANNVQGSISGVSNFFKGFVDVAAPLAQKAVAVIVDSLFGDKTGNLYNQINGVDAKVAAIKNSVQNVINNQTNFYKGLLENFVGGLGEVSNFVIGALMGEFNDNPSIWQTLLDTAIGMIPIVGEIGDVRDLIAYTMKFTDKPEEMQDPWNWVGVAGSLIGLIPVVGGAIKGVTKVARNANFIKEIEKLGPTVVAAVIDFIKKTDLSALSPLAKKSTDFFAKIQDTIKNLITMIRDGIQRGKEVWSSLKQPVSNKIEETLSFLSRQLENIENLKKESFKKLQEAFDWLKNKLDDLKVNFSRTQPSKPKGSAPSGYKTDIPASQQDPTVIRSLTRENESADTLAFAGYDVEQNPPKLPNGKEPDYIIEGKIFDCFSPSTSSPRNIASYIESKVVSGQTERIILNLDDSSVSLDDLRKQMTDYPIKDLQEVIVVRGGNVEPFFPW